jgi:hypothetical protein
MVFRYYDPRVLRAYLPTCSIGELRTVFGPIECFWMEDKSPGTALEFRLDQGRLTGRSFSIDLTQSTARTPTPSDAEALVLKDSDHARK